MDPRVQLLGSLVLALLAAAPAQATVSTVRVATGLTRPVFAAAPPGDYGRLFVAEQHSGQIRILDLATNQLAATPFLTLSFLALSVIPHLKITDQGLVDVDRFEVVPLTA